MERPDSAMERPDSAMERLQENSRVGGDFPHPHIKSGQDGPLVGVCQNYLSFLNG